MKRRLEFILSSLICFSVLFLTVGYSAFNSRIAVEQIGAVVRVQADIRVTNFMPYGNNHDGISESENYNVSAVAGRVYLPYVDSSVTYQVEVTNFGNARMGIYDITGLPSNLKYELSDYTMKETICDEDNQCVSGIRKYFNVTIRYKDNGYNASNQYYDFALDINFRKVFNVTYVDITGNNPATVLDGDRLEVNIGSGRTATVVGDASHSYVLNTDFVVANGVLRIYEVNSDITITAIQARDYFYTYIQNLYNSSSKVNVTSGTGSDTIDYTYAPLSTSGGLMKDREGSSDNSIDFGNIRYYGGDPYNYVYFNCNNYESPSASTCEVWRIVGVFGDKVKIVRNQTLGLHIYDNKYGGEGSAVATDAGSNDWRDARLMLLLNPGYPEIGNDVYQYTRGLYYNGGSGICYIQNRSTTDCNFTNSGLRNDDTRAMVASVTLPMGSIGNSNVSIYAHEAYVSEHNTSNTWTGYVSLPYASDYGYAADLTMCTNRYNLSAYNNTVCKNSNYLFKILTNNGGGLGWLLTSYSNQTYSQLNVMSNGKVSTHTLIRNNGNVVPVVYLNSTVEKTGGNGTSTSPYTIRNT